MIPKVVVKEKALGKIEVSVVHIPAPFKGSLNNPLGRITGGPEMPQAFRKKLRFETTPGTDFAYGENYVFSPYQTVYVP